MGENRMNSRAYLGLLSLSVMAACSPNAGPTPSSAEAVQASVASSDAPPAEQRATLPDPRKSGDLGPNDKPDACGASKHQDLVGKPRSAIPAKPDGAVWRVYSTTDAVTMDYSEARMNIVWDAKTGMVVEVKCG